MSGLHNTYVLWTSQGHTGDAWNADEAELSNGLARLLLAAVVDNSGSSRWDSLVLGLGVGVDVDDLLLDLLILVNLLDAWVGHDCGFGGKLLAGGSGRGIRGSNFEFCDCGSHFGGDVWRDHQMGTFECAQSTLSTIVHTWVVRIT